MKLNKTEFNLARPLLFSKPLKKKGNFAAMYNGKLHVNIFKFKDSYFDLNHAVYQGFPSEFLKWR